VVTSTVVTTCPGKKSQFSRDAHLSRFRATVCQTVRPMLLSVCSVCDDGVLWQNGWIDHDETRHGDRPRPRPYCVRWGPSSSPQKGHSPQFSAHVCCGQTAGSIKMPLGTEVDLGPGDIVLDGHPALTYSPSKRGRGTEPHNFGPCSMAKWLHGSRCHLVQW